MRLNHVLRTTQTILLAVMMSGAAGCATTKSRHEWTDRALRAESAQAEGRLDTAQTAYEELLPTAPDDDRRRWIEFNVGLLALERGEPAEAQRRFERIYREEIADVHGANALYEVAKLADDDASGLPIRLKLIRRYPEQVAAEFALQDIVRSHLKTDEEERLEALLEELHGDVDGTEVGDNVLFELARLRDEHLDDPDGALDAYRALYAVDPNGPLADDALWEMAAIYRRHQAWEPAIALLRRLATDVDESWFIGSYASEWVDDATFTIGWIHLLFRADYDESAKWFKRYLKRHPHGLLADDAAWNLVEAARLSGDDRRYRRELRAFLQDYPESRYVRRARARLGGES